MRIATTIRKYTTIIEYLKRRNGTSFNDLKAYLEKIDTHNELSFSDQTFRRDRKDIAELFGIEIEYNQGKNEYFIQEESPKSSVTKLLEAFYVHQALGTNKEKADFVHFESRKPTNVACFEPLINAIQKSQKLQILYHKFDTGNVFERTLEPYALKEFKNRWYLIARDTHDQRLKTYALDRINKVTALQEYFTKDEKVDIEQLYAHCFGIIMPNDEQILETVALSFDVHQGKYIKSLPLHPYQQVIVDTEDELRIELKVYITYDFILEILSHGNRVKVLAPQSLIDNEIKWRIAEMAKRYE